MNTLPPIVVCTVGSTSLEMLRAVENIARDKSSLDGPREDIGVSFPDGVERVVERRSYRLGDYFENVTVADETSEPPEFKLVFRVRLNADRFWLDAVSEILIAVRNAGATVKSVTRQS